MKTIYLQITDKTPTIQFTATQGPVDKRSFEVQVKNGAFALYSTLDDGTYVRWDLSIDWALGLVTAPMFLSDEGNFKAKALLNKNADLVLDSTRTPTTGYVWIVTSKSDGSFAIHDVALNRDAIRCDPNGKITLFDKNNNVAAIVLPDGKVGIGTSTPKSTLDIQGTSSTVAINLPAAATHALDFSKGQVFNFTVTGATTISFSNVPAGRSTTAVIHITNGGAGVVTWPASVKWSGGLSPSLTPAGQDVISLMTLDGTTWFGGIFAKDAK